MSLIARAFRRRLGLRASLEALVGEDTSGKLNREPEQVFYAKINDYTQFKQAQSATHQEQWSFKIGKTDDNAGAGNIRVRKVYDLREDNPTPEFILTTKMKTSDPSQSLEVPIATSEANFDMFTYLCDQGMIKDRFVFPIADSECKWEVDVYPAPGGGYHEWVKIDLEKWPKDQSLPPFPIAFTEIINGTPGTMDEETNARVTELYEKVFLTKNIHLNKKA